MNPNIHKTGQIFSSCVLKHLQHKPSLVLANSLNQKKSMAKAGIGRKHTSKRRLTEPMKPDTPKIFDTAMGNNIGCSKDSIKLYGCSNNKPQSV